MILVIYMIFQFGYYLYGNLGNLVQTLTGSISTLKTYDKLKFVDEEA